MNVATDKKIKYISFATPELWNINIEEYDSNSTSEYKKHTTLKISDILQTKPFSDKDKILYLSTPEIDPNAPNWYNFASRNIPDRIDLSQKCVLGFELNEEKILHISNIEDIDKFEKEYVICPDDISEEDRILCDYYGFVNWKKVSDKYHGLIVNPYIVKNIKFRIWYDSFDVNTAMIWNHDAIKNVYILYTPRYGINTKIIGTPIHTAKTGGDSSDSVRSRYAIISGEVDPIDRENIQKVLNSPGNINGELISVLLISKTGAEGLDLKGVRQVHLIEPYWDKAREDQVKSRGIRLGSHSHLPPDQRNVQPYLYISVANKQVFEGMSTRVDRETETIDEQFHQKAVINYKINMAFRTLLQEVSIECAFNDYKNCKVCMPDDKPLYTNSFIQDLHLPDPCKNVEEQEVEVNELVFNNKPYYYQKNAESFTGYEFFEHNAKIDAYTPISKSTPLFLELSEYLINMDTQKSLNTIAEIIGRAESEKHTYNIFVSEPWFGYIKSGEKTIEGRKNKGDFKKMQPGDIVKWICSDDSVLTEITGKRSYKTFKEYLETEGLNKCLPGIETIEAGVAIYHKYYTLEDEAKYGALAIEIKKI